VRLKKVVAVYKQGLTLVEVLVALVLLGVLGLISLGIVLPLRLNRDANLDTQATGLARSYLELVKTRWLDLPTFNALTLPNVCTTAAPTCDLVINTGWTVEVPATVVTGWAATDNLRTVTVLVRQPGGNVVELSTLVARP
jgi:prepilin-type N-terminal cleavage/methylation domain-containing protein